MNFSLSPGDVPMLIKLNAKNQIMLPKSLMQAVGPTDYFDVQAKGGQIVLTPVRLVAADAVRAKLAELGIAEVDKTAAVDWSRAQAPAT
jgi:antitoxin component of MazEF toxin-antitoxin module